jgi:hypothetical protein
MKAFESVDPITSPVVVGCESLGVFEAGARFCLGFYCVRSVWAVGSHPPFTRPFPVMELGRSKKKGAEFLHI